MTNFLFDLFASTEQNFSDFFSCVSAVPWREFHFRCCDCIISRDSEIIIIHIVGKIMTEKVLTYQSPVFTCDTLFPLACMQCKKALTSNTRTTSKKANTHTKNVRDRSSFITGLFYVNIFK
jgi:hypothetical protein